MSFSTSPALRPLSPSFEIQRIIECEAEIDSDEEFLNVIAQTNKLSLVHFRSINQSDISSDSITSQCIRPIPLMTPTPRRVTPSSSASQSSAGSTPSSFSPLIISTNTTPQSPQSSTSTPASQLRSPFLATPISQTSQNLAIFSLSNPIIAQVSQPVAPRGILPQMGYRLIIDDKVANPADNLQQNQSYSNKRRCIIIE